jgi:predicted nucleic acid-binding protein
VIVVDTNVIVHLVTGSPEFGEKAAALLRSDPDWAAPSILLSELRNVLIGFVRSGWVELSEAMAMQDDAVALLGDRITAVDGAAVLEVAAAMGLSAYDAEFVVTAKALRCEFRSLDQKILDAAPDLARSL